MAWSFEGSRDSDLAPPAIWAVYSEVRRWPEWAEDIVHAQLDGAFQAGAHGRVRYTGAPTLPFTVDLAEPPHRYVTEVRVPFLHLRFDHRIEPAGTGSRVTERITFSGPLGGLVGTLRGRGASRRWDLAIGQMLRLAGEGSVRGGPE